MSDEDKDARRIGRDEMNLCEFPIATLAERTPTGRVSICSVPQSEGGFTDQ